MLQKRRFPTQLLKRLNLEPGSPLYRLIRMPTMPEGLIKDNSMIKAISANVSA
jgi:hypothetical protein